MLKISIDFSPIIKDEHVTNNIRVLTDTTRVTFEDLITALGVCAAMRRSSSILDSMVIEINKADVKIIPTNKKFETVNSAEAEFVSPEMIPYVHQFFMDLRKDINIGLQDHMSLESEGPKVRKGNPRSQKVNPNKTNIIKRWGKK